MGSSERNQTDSGIDEEGIVLFHAAAEAEAKSHTWHN